MINAKRILTAPTLCTAMALGVSGVAAGAASAETLLHEGSETGSVIPEGTGGTGTSSNLVFHTELGNIECSSSVLEGVVSKDKAGENAVLEVAKGSFTGNEVEKECHTTILGEPAKITSTGEPWFVEFLPEGKTTITGTPKIDFTAEISGLTCSYEAATLEDMWTNPLGDSLEKQVMTREAGSSEGCPASGELSGTFTVVTETGESVWVT